jgi:hypothetical protein
MHMYIDLESSTDTCGPFDGRTVTYRGKSKLGALSVFGEQYIDL